MAHELEHGLQLDRIDRARVLQNSSAATIKTALSLLFNPAQKWRLEYGAMRAEWELLHALPPEMVEQAKPAVAKVANPTIRGHLLRSLENAQLDFDHYIEAEFHAGRYSPGNILLLSATRMVVAGVAAEISFMALKKGGKVTTQKSCAALSPENPIQRHFCQPAAAVE